MFVNFKQVLLSEVDVEVLKLLVVKVKKIYKGQSKVDEDIL